MERYEVKSSELHLAFDPKQEGLTTVYLASEVDPKFKEYDDDNLALSQSVVKLGARIAELEKQLLARGGHNSDCPVSWKGECYCGWEEMKKSLMVSVTK